MSVKVTVVSPGRFWAFDLAEQMRRRGCLGQLYTGYPWFKVDAPLRPLTSTFPWLFAVYMAAGRFGFRRLAGLAGQVSLVATFRQADSPPEEEYRLMSLTAQGHMAQYRFDAMAEGIIAAARFVSSGQSS
jgi:hypothetical protein